MDNFRRKFSISGMRCVLCAQSIESSLNKEAGIKRSSVSFDAKEAVVELKDLTMDDRKIIGIIKKAGFKAKTIEKAEPEIHLSHSDKIRKKRNKLIGGVVLTIPVVLLSIVLKDQSALSKIVQAILAGFVQFYIGYEFYHRAWHALTKKRIDINVLVVLTTSVIYFYSLVITFIAIDNVFYEASSFLITFMIFGEYLNIRNKKMEEDK